MRIIKGGKSPEKISLLIWGCNEFSAHLCHLLEKHQVKVIAFIDATGNDHFCDKPIFSPKKIQSMHELSTTPIVVAAPHSMSNNVPGVDFESVYQFKIKVQEINHEHQIKNDLLHPAALIDFVSVSYPNRIIPFGLPGSGITLFNQLCTKIVEEYQHFFKTRDKTSLFFEKMCYEYTQCIHQIMPDMTYLHDGANFHMGAWKIGTTLAIFSLKEVQMEIYSFPTRNHVIGPVYNYHQMPSQKYLDDLSAQKFKLFFMMRNPLDVIVSFVNKAGGLDKTTKQINMDTFCYVSKWLLEQLNIWYPLTRGLRTFTYDNLMKNPISEIKNIMKMLNVTPSTKIAKKIWQQSSFRQLSTAPKKHFWSGGSGKWESYFKKEHFSFLKTCGVEEVLEKYHYPMVLEKFKQLASDISPNEWQPYCSEQMQNKLNDPKSAAYGDEHEDTFALLKRKYGEDHCAKTNSLYITGSDPALIEKIKQSIDSKYINQLVLAGAHASYRIV